VIETRIVADDLKGCQFGVVRLTAVMVDSPPFGPARCPDVQFSTPVEKPVEIEGFWQVARVTY
jgi:hypothetical protein